MSSTPRGARLARLLATEWLRTWDLPYGVPDRAAHVVAEPGTRCRNCTERQAQPPAFTAV